MIIAEGVSWLMVVAIAGGRLRRSLVLPVGARWERRWDDLIRENSYDRKWSETDTPAHMLGRFGGERKRAPLREAR